MHCLHWIHISLVCITYSWLEHFVRDSFHNSTYYLCVFNANQFASNTHTMQFSWFNLLYHKLNRVLALFAIEKQYLFWMPYLLWWRWENLSFNSRLYFFANLKRENQTRSRFSDVSKCYCSFLEKPFVDVSEPHCWYFLEMYSCRLYFEVNCRAIFHAFMDIAQCVCCFLNVCRCIPFDLSRNPFYRDYASSN